MKKPHCISLHYSARPYLNMLIMMMNIMLMRIKRIMILVTMAENDGVRPYLNMRMMVVVVILIRMMMILMVVIVTIRRSNEREQHSLEI